MKNISKKYTWHLAVLILIVLAFFVGHWSGALQMSLQNESAYPWNLHKKIANINIQCDALYSESNTGNFYVKSIDNGSILIVATLDRSTDAVIAYALDTEGNVASDSWQLSCQ